MLLGREKPCVSVIVLATTVDFGLEKTLASLADFGDEVGEILVLCSSAKKESLESRLATHTSRGVSSLREIWCSPEHLLKDDYRIALEHSQSDYVCFLIPGAVFSGKFTKSLSELGHQDSWPDAVCYLCAYGEKNSSAAGNRITPEDVKSPSRVPDFYWVRREVALHLGLLEWTTPDSMAWHFWLSFVAHGYDAWLVSDGAMRSRFSNLDKFNRDTLRLHYAQTILYYSNLYTAHEVCAAYKIIAKHRYGVPKVDLSDSTHEITVVVPTFNRPELLSRALESIAKQTFRDFEVVVVNDGHLPVAHSIGPYAETMPIRLINHARNRGLPAARNTALSVARGKYIAYLDDDDVYLPKHLEMLWTELEKSECQVVYSNARRVRWDIEDGREVHLESDIPYGEEFSLCHLLVRNFIPVLSMMHGRECLFAVGMFDESLECQEDWDLWIRLGLQYDMIHLDEVTAEFTWRTDGSTMTSSGEEKFVESTHVIHEKYAKMSEKIESLREIQKEHLRLIRSGSDTVVEARTIVCNG